MKKKRSASVWRTIPWTGWKGAAADEDYWAIIQNAFSVTRDIIDLNNGLSPSLRIATEALVPAGDRNL